MNAAKNSRSPRGPLWSREETMIAFNLYSKIPYGQIHDYHPDIVRLAEVLERPPASLSWKMCNLASLDPQHIGRIKGTRIAKMERTVWGEFNDDPGRFMVETERLLRERAGSSPDDLAAESELQDLPPGETRRRLTNVRTHQALFRKIVLSSYNNRCCITGIGTPELLNASHIVPWRENPNHRTNPRNGLCLNALHDRAFDRGLISVGEDFKVCVSPQLRDAAKTKSQNDKMNFVIESEGQSITMPDRFAPDREFLNYHYREIFRK